MLFKERISTLICARQSLTYQATAFKIPVNLALLPDLGYSHCRYCLCNYYNQIHNSSHILFKKSYASAYLSKLELWVLQHRRGT